MKPLTAEDVDRMGWAAMATRVRTWRSLVHEYARLHHQAYHVTPRSKRSTCQCPWGVAS